MIKMLSIIFSLIAYFIFLPLNVVDAPLAEEWQMNETSVSLSTIQDVFLFFSQLSNTMVFFSLS